MSKGVASRKAKLQLKQKAACPSHLHGGKETPQLPRKSARGALITERGRLSNDPSLGPHPSPGYENKVAFRIDLEERKKERKKPGLASTT